MKKEYKIAEELIDRLYNEEYIKFTTRELVMNFGNTKDINKVYETNQVQTSYVKRSIKNLELNNMTCEKEKVNCYKVSIVDKTMQINDDELKEKQEEKVIEMPVALKIRPLSKQDLKLLRFDDKGSNSSSYLRTLMCGLLLNKMINSAYTDDVGFFNEEIHKDSEVYKSYGSRNFFLASLNAVNVFNCAISNTVLSNEKRKKIAENSTLTIDSIAALCEELNRCLYDCFEDTLDLMLSSKLIEFIPIRIGVKHSTNTINLANGDVVCKKEISYTRFTNEQDFILLTIMDDLKRRYPSLTTEFLIIKNSAASALRRTLIKEKLGFDDYFRAYSITYKNLSTVRAFFAYHTDFNEAKYLEEFYTSMQTKVMTRKRVDTLPEAEKELIKDICLSMLDPKSEDLFEKPAPKVVDMNVEKEVHIINVNQEII